MTPLAVLGLVVTAAALSASAAAVLASRSAARRCRTETDRLLHALKNPVQSILLHADLLGDATLTGGDGGRSELCTAIVAEAQRLAGIMADHAARSDARARQDLVAGSDPLGPADAAV